MKKYILIFCIVFIGIVNIKAATPTPTPDYIIRPTDHVNSITDNIIEVECKVKNTLTNKQPDIDILYEKMFLSAAFVYTGNKVTMYLIVPSKYVDAVIKKITEICPDCKIKDKKVKPTPTVTPTVTR